MANLYRRHELADGSHSSTHRQLPPNSILLCAFSSANLKLSPSCPQTCVVPPAQCICIYRSNSVTQCSSNKGNLDSRLVPLIKLFFFSLFLTSFLFCLFSRILHILGYLGSQFSSSDTRVFELKGFLDSQTLIWNQSDRASLGDEVAGCFHEG